MKTLAKIISLILGPAILWPITLFILVFKTHLTKTQITILLPILLVLQAIIPLGYILWAFKTGKISDLDLTRKEDRRTPLFIASLSLLLSLIFIYFLANKLLFNLFLLIFIALIVNAFVTLFWKISLHMAINVMSSLLINFLFNWQLPILYLTIPLVFWSRLYLKKHTVAQLLGAFLLNAGIIFLFSFSLSFK